jgi:hypothetical protein
LGLQLFTGPLHLLNAGGKGAQPSTRFLKIKKYLIETCINFYQKLLTTKNEKKKLDKTVLSLQ